MALGNNKHNFLIFITLKYFEGSFVSF